MHGGGEGELHALTPPYPVGSNMLLVGVQGPRTPCEEVVVKHLGNRLYSVAYLLRERGDHILVLKWGDQHTPGSPFRVTVP